MSASSLDPNVFDTAGLAALRRQVKGSDPKALKQVAQQFEALFLQMVLKSMRDATPQEGLFDSDQTRLYQSLLDQQLAQVMVHRGGTGLAAVIERQLTRNTSDPAAASDVLSAPPRAVVTPSISTPDMASGQTRIANDDPEGFVGQIWAAATEAARTTGIPPHFLVAHAALETGWGRSEPRDANGFPSYNLFGIKAGRDWSGPTIDAVTTEYVDGMQQRETARFKAYGSYDEAFRDYARLLQSPRYAGVIGVQDPASFARGLQRAGYATDPMYAAKLERIISGNRLRQALTG
ncbi:MAG: flagellar assembly peptidoglycan hydrolase FlgJ [Proteobacteria bacterium]|nr:flagellar assembly peptidoglycan hydrolase FlgJ [Pseudomonadota bacterium]HQR05000.1 flagellar assembly peptidoglycan hydrolase FlgJ [Rhodocyclaceae bacterium]